MPERIPMDMLCEIIAAVPYDIQTEASLQFGIANRLVETGVEYSREVPLTPADRIDFMVGRIGVEVKIGGGKTALIRQLFRYAQSAEVDELVLVTTAPGLTFIPRTLNSKPVRTLVLSACLF